MSSVKIDNLRVAQDQVPREAKNYHSPTRRERILTHIQRVMSGSYVSRCKNAPVSNE